MELFRYTGFIIVTLHCGRTINGSKKALLLCWVDRVDHYHMLNSVIPVRTGR